MEVAHYKDAVRNLFGHLAAKIRPKEPSAADSLADALYLLFEGAAVASRNHNHTWPFSAARQAALQMIEGSQKKPAKKFPH